MLPSISINNTSATYPESINENNNDEVNGLVQELKNLFNGKEGISTCIKPVSYTHLEPDLDE